MARAKPRPTGLSGSWRQPTWWTTRRRKVQPDATFETECGPGRDSCAKRAVWHQRSTSDRRRPARAPGIARDGGLAVLVAGTAVYVGTQAGGPARPRRRPSSGSVLDHDHGARLMLRPSPSPRPFGPRSRIGGAGSDARRARPGPDTGGGAARRRAHGGLQQRLEPACSCSGRVPL